VVEPNRVYTEDVERLRARVRRPAIESRATVIGRAAGLVAGRVGCRLEEAHTQLARLAREQGRDLADVAASAIELLDAGGDRAGAGTLSVTDVDVALRSVRGPGGRPSPAVGGARTAPTPGIQEILDAVPGSVALLSPVRDGAGRVTDYLIDAASPESSDMSGRHGTQLVGLRLSDAYGVMPGGDLRGMYDRVLATGTAEQVGPFPYAEDSPGTPAGVSYSIRAHRVGAGLLVTWSRQDEEPRQSERIEQTERLGNLGWGEWDLIDGRIEWSDQLYRIYERDPADGPMPSAESEALTLPEDLSIVAAAAEAFLRGERFDAVYRVRINGRVKHLRTVIDAVRDAAGEPMKIYGIIQDVTVREITLARLADVERRLDEQQRTLDAEHRLAAQLQNIILPIPEHPIDLPGLRVALRYLPAEHLSRVGGDWYHAAALPDGRTLLAIGDVAGHGVPAATTMAQLRHALRALTVTTSTPAELMTYLNRLMCDIAGTTAVSTATAIIARFDPTDNSLTWSQAGHPAPLLTRAGSTVPLPRPTGMMLGVAPTASYESAHTSLEPGDVLLLYTDGLIEHRSRTLDEGLAAVIGTVDSAIAAGPDQPLTALLARLRRANPDDDTCILAARPQLAPPGDDHRGER
jgi:serine phosphatase RsbU (regulator of sigma subunit)/PAS domain-containing protein